MKEIKVNSCYDCPAITRRKKTSFYDCRLSSKASIHYKDFFQEKTAEGCPLEDSDIKLTKK